VGGPESSPHFTHHVPPIARAREKGKKALGKIHIFNSSPSPRGEGGREKEIPPLFPSSRSGESRHAHIRSCGSGGEKGGEKDPVPVISIFWTARRKGGKGGKGKSEGRTLILLAKPAGGRTTQREREREGKPQGAL